MKPICLTVHAFGPYAGKQVFDFRQLQDRCLFLITGPTGSGKTTVLDAICYGLYGDTSGKERDAAQMRSQHSDPATATEVTFDFVLGSDSYRVWRKPQQDRPKKRGDGTITEAAQAMLYKRTGIVDDSDAGQPLATRTNDVTTEVERLLGFRSAQFRQVVMLPQGKFTELLKADSTQRQEILETLFHTGIYRQIEQALKDARRALHDQLDELKIRRQQVLDLASVENEAHLSAQLEAAKADLTKITDDIKQRRSAKSNADAALAAGKEAQAKLSELDVAAKALKQLVDRQADIDAKVKQRDLGKRASELRDAESQRDRRAKECKKAAKALEDMLAAQAAEQANLDKASADLNAQKSRQGEMESLRKEQDRLEGLVTRVKNLAAAQSELDELKKAAKLVANELSQTKKQLTAAEADLKSKQKDLTKAEKLAALVDARLELVKQAESDATNLGKLTQADVKVKRLTADHSTAATAATQAQDDLDAAVKKLQGMEKALQDGYAGHLAKSLKKGDPCPVCGSKDHPAPSKAAADVPAPEELDGLRDEIKALEKSRRAADKKESSLRTELAVTKQAATALHEQLGDKAQADPDHLQDVLATRRSELAAAKQAQATAGELQEAIETLGAAKETLATNVEQLQTNVLDQDGKVRTMTGTVNERQAEVPDDLRDPKLLKSAIAEKKATLKQLADALESAQTAAKIASEAVAGTKAATKAARESADTARQTAEAETASFLQRLRDGGFETEMQYKASKLVDEQITMLDNQIETHGRHVAAAKDRLDRAETAATGVQQPDVPALNTAVTEAQTALEASVRQQSELVGRQNQIGQWLKALAEDSQKTADLENQYQTVGYIADVANGTNSQNVTFQRFVLGALLDDVLLAASQRLKIMSKGRYLLQRQQDTVDRRRAGGLDLEVHDAYTGMSRPAGTLSGGESFLAALSLALGLADVVQSYAGGVYLDTIFIDEGFGSLDSEALDAAMQALVDLQNGGRLVGIISHVPELKERIDTRLEIKKGQTGSSAEFVMA